MRISVGAFIPAAPFQAIASRASRRSPAGSGPTHRQTLPLGGVCVNRTSMVLTSHEQLGNTGRKTGFWLEELAAPYYVFKDAGAQITLASPKGGRPPLDPKSNEPNFQTEITRRFEKDADGNAQLGRTARLDSVKQ